MEFLSAQQLAFIFGLLGNIVGFLVFLAPIPTFYTICKKKSSEGFQAVPYVTALLSAFLLLYYGVVKTHAILIVTINAIGLVIETTYLIIYILYAPRKDKIRTLVLILLVNVVGFGGVVLVTTFAFEGLNRVHAVGWVVAVFNIAVFAAPLSVLRQVIKTRSVEYMPFSLSLALTMCATVWFFYGLFVRDYYIATPNVLGFCFGAAQMIVYVIYKNAKKKGNDHDPKHDKSCCDASLDIMMNQFENTKLHTSSVSLVQSGQNEDMV